MCDGCGQMDVVKTRIELLNKANQTYWENLNRIGTAEDFEMPGMRKILNDITKQYFGLTGHVAVVLSALNEDLSYLGFDAVRIQTFSGLDFGKQFVCKADVNEGMLNNNEDYYYRVRDLGNGGYGYWEYAKLSDATDSERAELDIIRKMILEYDLGVYELMGYCPHCGAKRWGDTYGMTFCCNKCMQISTRMDAKMYALNK